MAESAPQASWVGYVVMSPLDQPSQFGVRDLLLVMVSCSPCIQIRSNRSKVFSHVVLSTSPILDIC